MRCLILDGIGQRYGCLPSTVLGESDTLDLLVLDVARSWENYQQNKHKAQAEGKPQEHQIPVNTLEEMMQRVQDR
jgi:hypothetical protein|tara:strand:- start:4727 stop:4951 length:225 start_codon:yes stop_codon:yes gene_type:complete